MAEAMGNGVGATGPHHHAAGGEGRRSDRRMALALAVVFGLLTLSAAVQRQEGMMRYAKVRELTVEFTRLVQQLEKPSAWGF